MWEHRLRRPHNELSRRKLLQGAVAIGALGPSLAAHAATPSPGVLTRTIPATGESLPAIGMGSWITFNVGDDETLRRQRLEVLRTLFQMGGTLVDSSPMYGSSEEVIGYCLREMGGTSPLFSATKVWTPFQGLGVRQMENSEALWGVTRFNLMQIHNLLDWEAHLETLLDWKAQGRVRYIGITTSHGRRHDDFESIMRTQPIDFVQFTYNIRDREAEARLLPLARERGLGVIINRPFRRGWLMDTYEKHPLPDWAAEFDCANWAQFFLKFIVSHPAVTCAIPATSRVEHMRGNMGALTGRLPDPDMRARMFRHVESL
jgi:diketogulonate reductase-like aldo/keto reductase